MVAADMGLVSMVRQGILALQLLPPNSSSGDVFITHLSKQIDNVKEETSTPPGAQASGPAQNFCGREQFSKWKIKQPLSERNRAGDCQVSSVLES